MSSIKDPRIVLTYRRYVTNLLETFIPRQSLLFIEQIRHDKLAMDSRSFWILLRANHLDHRAEDSLPSWEVFPFLGDWRAADGLWGYANSGIAI